MLTSDTLWALGVRLERLALLGGALIGCETAQAFARLGSRVTLIEMAPLLLMREDTEVSALVERRFRAEGTDVLLGHEVKRIEVDDEGQALIAAHEVREVRVSFDALLVAVGRVAILKGYGLGDLRVPTSKTIEVNSFLQTRFPTLYAAGDVAGPYQFTHTASHQAWYAAVNALVDPFWRRG